MDNPEWNMIKNKRIWFFLLKETKKNKKKNNENPKK